MKPARLLFFLVVILAAAAVYFLGVRPRQHNTAALDARAVAAGRPIVNVATAQRREAPVDVLLPATLSAFQDTSLYARTNGYISRWLVDLGDRVATGQTLAVIDAPELDQQLAQARAALAQTKASLALAKLDADRWKTLITQNVVSQQELDEKESALTVAQANADAADANVRQIAQLKQYQTVIAPFDGVISARNAEVGQIVTAGAGKELFHLTQTDPLRVYVDVPQTYVRAIGAGLPADVTVTEFPGRVFAGKIVRFAGALDQSSRTLRTEIDMPNSKGELYVGMFGQVRLRLSGGSSLLVPSNAIIIRPTGPLVAALTEDNHVHLQPVKVGRDYGTQIEVVDGLADGTRLVANPRDSLAEGLQVEPAPPAPKAN